MKRILLCLTFTYVLFSYISAQKNNLPETNTSQNNFTQNNITINLNSQLAMATADYMVTAGDIYTLTYATGPATITYPVLVDSSYKIRVSNLAVIDSSGKTYLEVKNLVETIVSKNYPLSGVQFILTNPGTFNVIIKGEVITTSEQKAWGLSRLSSVIGDKTTEFSSIRNIMITSSNGINNSYDLFIAERFGDLSQNPYVRPGDVITIKRLLRSVKITGAVERPGTYQLLDGENLLKLIHYYANGYTSMADKNRIELIKQKKTEFIPGEKILLNDKEILDDFTLDNYDEINVLSISEFMPVLFVEGAITPISISTNTEMKIPITSTENRNEASPEASTRIIIPFNVGESYTSLIRRNKAWFSEISDISNAYIIRNKSQLPLDVFSIIYDSTYNNTLMVEEKDTLVIPFRQYFVSVFGAIANPGRYPFIQGRDWTYYIALAGGFDTTRNNFSMVTITDNKGMKRTKKDEITPETVITASSNTVRYYLSQYSPLLITTGLMIGGLSAILKFIQLF